MADLDISGYFRDAKTLFYNHINTLYEQDKMLSFNQLHIQHVSV